MQALLSFDKAPPFAAPLRFFLTAPIFAMLAGLLLAWSGGEMLASRWMPDLLAAVHLLTIGFMLQIMLGAMIQILPVVAGANLARPLRVASWLHGGLSTGAILLAAGFWFGQPALLSAAALALGLSTFAFLGAAGRALSGVPSTSPTIRGLKLALGALAVAVLLGAVLALALARGWPLPIMHLADLHAGWALGAWGGTLLAAMAYVVVPMFQLTPGYPARPSWWFPGLLIALALTWGAAVIGESEWGIRAAQGGMALVGIAFAVLTLRLQGQRRRARADVTYRYWQLGLYCAIFALFQALTATIVPQLAEWAGWSILFGILMVVGAFMSFIVGMLYKIVPFLAWLHLQNAGCVPAPAMNKLLADAPMQRQWQAHVLALILLLGAVVLPDLLARLAGLALAVAAGGLFYNLLAAVRRYRTYLEAAKTR